MENTMCCAPDWLWSVHNCNTIAIKCVTAPKRIVRGIITEGGRSKRRELIWLSAQALKLLCEEESSDWDLTIDRFG